MTILDDAKNMVTRKMEQAAREREERKTADEAKWRTAILSALEVLGARNPRLEYGDKLEPIEWGPKDEAVGWTDPPPRFQVRLEDEKLIVRNASPRYEDHIELEEIGTGQKIVVNLVSPTHDDQRATRAQWTKQIAKEWYGL